MQRQQLYSVGIAGSGLLLAGVQLAQGLQQSSRPVVFAFETVPFVLIALALAYTGGWLYGQSEFAGDMPVIVAWGLGSTLLFASVAALLLFSQQVTLGTLEQAQFVTMNHVTVGAVVGVLVGLYDARSRHRERELERQRDRVEAFANKAADVNNYGRALNGCESNEEVSSLCIQGVQALLGFSEMATVVVDESTTRVIDSTVAGIDTEAITELARKGARQETGTVKTDKSLPNLSESVLTVAITSQGDASVVLVARMTQDGLEEEDIKLFELLIAHARTAIDRIHEGGTLRAEQPAR